MINGIPSSNYYSHNLSAVHLQLLGHSAAGRTCESINVENPDSPVNLSKVDADGKLYHLFYFIRANHKLGFCKKQLASLADSPGVKKRKDESLR